MLIAISYAVVLGVIMSDLYDVLKSHGMKLCLNCKWFDGFDYYDHECYSCRGRIYFKWWVTCMCYDTSA